MSADPGAIEQTPTPSVPPARRAWWRMRRRTVLIGALLLTLLLVPVADVVARHATENAVASGMQKELKTAEKPDVSIGGTPFLTQLIGRKLSSVSLDVRGGTSCRMRMERMQAELKGVRQADGQVQVDSLRGRTLLSYTDLSASLAPLRLSGGSDGRVTISAGGSFLGATASGLPRIENGVLIIDPDGLTATLGGQTFLDSSLSSLPEMRIPLRDLPQNLNITLTPTDDGLALAFDGTDVRMNKSGSCPG